MKKLYKIIKPSEQHWVGDGFFVSTMFSVHSEDYKYITPFLLMDHAAPKKFPSTSRKLGVGVHPHRGFETVTFAVKGMIDHRDSGGGGGTIDTGGIQWMTAGSGVVHEEYHSKKFAETGGEFEMVQLWVNLPAKDKMTKPRYQSMNKEDCPVTLENNGEVEVKVVAGTFKDQKGPAQTFTPITMLEISSKSAQNFEFDLANNTTTLIIQLKSNSVIQDQPLKKGEVAVFERNGDHVAIKLEADSHILVLNGQPIDEPVSTYGPFVMNTREEIMQAVRDFEAGKMGNLVNEIS
jgi:quercetin 2,3-dioxygenase